MLMLNMFCTIVQRLVYIGKFSYIRRYFVLGCFFVRLKERVLSTILFLRVALCISFFFFLVLFIYGTAYPNDVNFLLLGCYIFCYDFLFTCD